MAPASSDNLRAAGILAVTMLLGVTSDTILKLVFARLPVGEVAFLRGVVVCAALLLFLWLRRQPPKSRDCLDPVAIARGILELGGALAFFMGLRSLPLATVITLVFASPLISIGLGAAVLRERVDLQRWAAALVGFAGVLLIVRPGPASFEPAALWPLLTALLMALRDLLTRTIPQRLDSGTIAFTTAAVVALGGLATLPFAWVTPGAAELGLIALGGLLVAVTYQTLVVAFRIGDMSFLAPFRYVSIPLSALFGWVVFGDRPGWQLLVGAAVIVASGGYIFYREHRLTRLAAAP
ncbi:MAG TPA: DMT family transporter [Geminicoccaceae bacterium]|nr:DMT family transporter [Geminicoccus sp.]HMU52914.1 DMT family transporter [Geminicoccaceae bacterium]